MYGGDPHMMIRTILLTACALGTLAHASNAHAEWGASVSLSYPIPMVIPAPQPRVVVHHYNPQPRRVVRKYVPVKRYVTTYVPSYTTAPYYKYYRKNPWKKVAQAMLGIPSKKKRVIIIHP